MDLTRGTQGRDEDIVDLVQATFTASEGAEEGRVLGDLVHNLLRDTPTGDLLVCTARAQGALAGVVVFSRLSYPEDPRDVFVLGPVAIATDRQRQGIGQKLIAFGLQELRSDGVALAMTYGDPAYYTKVGFSPADEAFAAAPFKLSQPHGWLAQQLTEAGLQPFEGQPDCVPAFDDPAFW